MCVIPTHARILGSVLRQEIVMTVTVLRAILDLFAKVSCNLVPRAFCLHG